MTRAIKFRAWTGAEMSEAATLQQLMSAINREGIDETSAWDAVYMQFTGLQDKNGTDIYEGDIVRTPDGELRSVVWEHHYFGVELDDGIKSTYGLPYTFEDCEVIGNIYESPQLLKARDV